MKKFFLLAFLFVILQIGNVLASVEKHTDKGVNYTMEYPIVYTNNKAAQDKINQDIYKYIAAFRDDYNAGKFYSGNFSYAVKFEDNNYVSLTITVFRVPAGAMMASQDYYAVYGFVYDKKTGRKLPLSNFVKITLNDLKIVYSPYEVYSEDFGEYGNNVGNKVQGWDFENTPDRVSEDYYLLGNGGIALIYKKYELAYGMAGPTTIRLSAEQVDYLNRKNRNL